MSTSFQNREMPEKPIACTFNNHYRQHKSPYTESHSWRCVGNGGKEFLQRYPLHRQHCQAFGKKQGRRPSCLKNRKGQGFVIIGIVTISNTSRGLKFPCRGGAWGDGIAPVKPPCCTLFVKVD